MTPAVLIATGLGVGFSPIMPGTVGALWGLPLAWSLAQLPLVARIPIIVLLCIAGIPICTAAAKAIGRKDPGSVVFDEIASLPITFLLVPAGSMSSPWVLASGFVLHRVFDISKPPPMGRLEKLPDGLGIMSDDWVAGLYSCAALHLLLWMNPGGLLVG
jgi:phosphatidylglycerophosphatase A